MVARKQTNSSRKEGASQELVHIKGTYRVLEKTTESSYRIKHLPFCKGLGRPKKLSN